MAAPDYNLLVVLDVLLAEGNVARAGRRLHLSPSAMSRSLARLRATMGDPLLVRAGRGLVPTPRALELREQVGQLVVDVAAVLRPAEGIDFAHLDGTFTVRTSDGFVEALGPALIARIAQDAPGVRLRFVQKLERSSTLLRDGLVDLDTGVVDDSTGPEVRTRALFSDRFIGVVRAGHPLVAGKVTAKRYASGHHVHVSRRGRDTGIIDDALAASGFSRDITAIVGGFASAIALARASDLIATVPEMHTIDLRAGMQAFALPFAVKPLTVSMMWHPRMDADPAHRWLRDCVRGVCVERFGEYGVAEPASLGR